MIYYYPSKTILFKKIQKSTLFIVYHKKGKNNPINILTN